MGGRDAQGILGPEEKSFEDFINNRDRKIAELETIAKARDMFPPPNRSAERYALRLEALRLAVSANFPFHTPEEAIERARKFGDFLDGKDGNGEPEQLSPEIVINYARDILSLQAGDTLSIVRVGLIHAVARWVLRNEPE